MSDIDIAFATGIKGLNKENQETLKNNCWFIITTTNSTSKFIQDMELLADITA